MFSEIAEIKSIREQKSKLSEREKELTEPILTDLDMIGMLYRWFQEIFLKRRYLGQGMLPNERIHFYHLVFVFSEYPCRRKDEKWPSR